MRGSFPNLQPNVPIEPRKITRSNMDNVINSLLLLINLSAFDGHTALSAAVTITYNRIQVMFNENPLETLSTLKLSRKWYVEWVRKNYLPNPGIRAWHWDSTNNRPIFLSAILDLMSEPEFSDNTRSLFLVRVAIALLSLDRVMVIPSKPSYDTIINPGITIDVKDSAYPSDIRTYVSSLGFTPEDFKKRYEHEVSTFRYTVLSSAGPNGDATWTAHSDARAWAINPTLFTLLNRFLHESNLDRLMHDLVATIPIETDKIKSHKDLRLGRIHSFDEWGGKVRTVAIVDYWTQMAMTPLHNTINYFLKNIKMDGTFDQFKVANLVRDWTKTKDLEVYSYDLTAATDRLPISLQVDILSVLLGNRELAVLWSKVLVERDYSVGNGDSVKYAVGQPMGARSSFPMLALTHHIIIQHSAHTAGIKDFSSYVVLGDDMTLVDGRVGANYLSTMEHLGVPINLSKSVVHTHGATSAGEICKRIFINGDEITTINPKLIAKVTRSGSLGSTLQDDLARRGFPLTSDFVTGYFHSLLDRESFKELVILNILPKSISGVSNPVNIPHPTLASYAKWFPGLGDFNESTIVNMFTYTAAVEALKRLDSLLRQTLIIGNAIAERWAMYTDSPVDIRVLWEILGIPTDVSSDAVSNLVSGFGNLTPNHPIIRASESEIERITELVSGLISVNTEMYNRARNGLLDITRNALIDIWQDKDEARAAASRTLLNKSLSNLKIMVAKGSTIDPRNPNVVIYKPEDMVMEYSITLSQIQRQWVVRVGLKDGVTINAVRSRINPSAYISSIEASKALKSITI